MKSGPAELAQPSGSALATLLALSRRTREARDPAELGFIAVNETHALAAYRQGILWMRGRGVTALSGVVSADANASFVQWANRLLSRLDEVAPDAMPRLLGTADLTPGESAEWDEWLPPHALWLPILGRDGRIGAMLLARDESWSAEETDLLEEWAGVLAQGFLSFSRTGRWTTGPRAAGIGGLRRAVPRPATIVVLLACAAIFLPVRLTVLAPAELVPVNPAAIRAPVDGVVSELLVAPNQAVKIGTPLFKFDRASIDSRLNVARQALASSRAEYRQRAQQGLYDQESRGKLAVIQGQVGERSSEVAYLEQMSSRGVVTAPRDGIVLYGDPTDWIGRPVVTGERVMIIADAKEVEVEAWLAPADLIRLGDRATVSMYLNASPDKPVAAVVRYLAYQAEERPDGGFAYRLRATLDGPAEQARVGMKGTAKVSGQDVTLAYWIFRRPLAAARAWLGV